MEKTESVLITGEQLESLVMKSTEKAQAAMQAQLDATTLEIERKQAAKVISPQIVVTNSDADKNEILASWVKSATRRDEAGLAKFQTNYPQMFNKVSNFTEASNGAGLYTVPTVWSSEIYTNVEKYGFARKFARVIPQDAYKMNLQGGASVTVAWPGIDTAPTVADATSAFTQTVLTLNTMAAAAIVTKELINESAANIMGYLTEQYALAIAKEEDKQFFIGSGSPFTGAISATGANVVYQGGASNSGKDTFAEISWTDLIALAGSVNTTVQRNAKFFVSQTVFNLLNVETAGSRPVWDYLRPTTIKGATGIDATAYQTPLGYDMVVLPNAVMPTTAVTTTSVIFADFSLAGIIGVNKNMTIDIFDQAYAGADLAGTRSVAMAITERISMGFPLGSAIGLLKTSTT